MTTPKTDTISAYEAVITGDIVDSQQLPSTQFQDVIEALNTYLTRLQTDYSFAYDIFRGDSYQLVIPGAGNAADIATRLLLFLKCRERPVSVRQCIGLGKPAQNRPASVKTAMGEAFTLSGRGLDGMKRPGLMVSTADASLNRQLDLVTKYFSNHLEKLTRVQAEVLLGYMEGHKPSHEQLADLLGKTRSNVTRILNASQYHLIDDYLVYYAELVEKDKQP